MNFKKSLKVFPHDAWPVSTAPPCPFRHFAILSFWAAWGKREVHAPQQKSFMERNMTICEEERLFLFCSFLFVTHDVIRIPCHFCVWGFETRMIDLAATESVEFGAQVRIQFAGISLVAKSSCSASLVGRSLTKLANDVSSLAWPVLGSQTHRWVLCMCWGWTNFFGSNLSGLQLPMSAGKRRKEANTFSLAKKTAKFKFLGSKKTQPGDRRLFLYLRSSDVSW